MNERIRELAEQAGAEQVATDPNGEFVKYITPEMQKFAELIVLECCFAVKPVAEYPMESVDVIEEFHRGYWVGCNDSTMRIKEHFGVDE